MSDRLQGASFEWTPQKAVLFIVTGACIVGCLMMASGFKAALTWAVALAVATRPVYCFLERKLKKPAVAALVSILLVLIVIVVPVVLLLYSLGTQLINVVEPLRSGAAQNWAQGMLNTYPRLNQAFQHVQALVSLKQASQTAASWLAGKVQGVLTGSVRTLTQIAIMLFTLFFLYKDARLARSAVLSVIPASAAKSDDVLKRMAETISASLRGSLLIAAIQAALGGLMFSILSVPQAFLWAFLMGLLALIPSLGTFMVWLPVVGFLALSGSPVKAAIMFAWGAGVIGSVDNVLYPKLVGSKLKLHTLAIFFAVLGGIAIFGLSGLVLGPLLLTTTLALLHLWNPAILPLDKGQSQLS